MLGPLLGSLLGPLLGSNLSAIFTLYKQENKAGGSPTPHCGHQPHSAQPLPILLLLLGSDKLHGEFALRHVRW